MESTRPSLTAYGAALHRAAHQIVDADGALNARYFSQRNDGLALGGTAHVMRARV